MSDNLNGPEFDRPGWAKESVDICANCDQPIFFDHFVWHHGPALGRHTVCDWYEGMEPTSRVAVPRGDTGACPGCGRFAPKHYAWCTPDLIAEGVVVSGN